MFCKCFLPDCHFSFDFAHVSFFFLLWNFSLNLSGRICPIFYCIWTLSCAWESWFFSSLKGHFIDGTCCCWSANSLHWSEAASRPVITLVSLNYPSSFSDSWASFCSWVFQPECDPPSLTAFPVDFIFQHQMWRHSLKKTVNTAPTIGKANSL